MLSAITLGSLASSPMIWSAGGQDEQPCEVKSSTTARGSAWAGRIIATMAQTPSALDHREIELWAIIAVIVRTGPGRFLSVFVRGIVLAINAHPRRKKAAFFIGRLLSGRYSRSSEASITNR